MAPTRETEIHEEEDIVVPVDKLRKGKKRSKDNVDDMVNALLGGPSKKPRKKAQKKDPAPPVLEEPESEVESDNIADLYTWDEPKEEEEEAPKEMHEERKRILGLAMIAASESEKQGSDMPRNEDEWFDRLDNEAGGMDTGHGESDSDMPTSVVKLADSKPHTVSKEKREAVGKFVAIDCEMVGAGFKGSRSMLARVSIVNYHGHVIMDQYVKPTEPVTDYRTWVSGIRKRDLDKGRPFKQVQAEVAELLKDRVLIGHAIKNDLSALMLAHPPLMTRDTARYPGFRKLSKKGSSPALRKLAASVLSIAIQEGEHSSVTDAKTAMLLYRKVREEWEKAVAPKRYKAEVKRVKTKERFAQLRAEMGERRELEATQQSKNQTNQRQLPRLK
ncbi:3'-5' exonuclease [Coemansia spiralis]|uniref:RNA exonuclease 4 n=1 Tax=Coemansia spiralis TaxID=417178 RepID=A0A9W8KXC2_9FUNG|nr:3'-5' exonuclease [Coemansia spiralis]